MKYWICKDRTGTYLYCGEIVPEQDKNGIFESVEDNYDWVEEDALNILGIKYPKDLKIGDCINLNIKIKTRWRKD
jgi:hypothetical protein